MKTRMYLLGFMIIFYVLILEDLNHGMTKNQEILFWLGIVTAIISIFIKDKKK